MENNFEMNGSDLPFGGEKVGPTNEDWLNIDLALSNAFENLQPAKPLSENKVTAPAKAIKVADKVAKPLEAMSPLEKERAGLDKDVLEFFLEDANQQVKELRKEWAVLKELSEVKAAHLEGFKRVIHTFKGNAGMIQANSLHELAHELETDLTEMEEGRLDWLACKEGIALSVHDIEEWVNWIQTPEHSLSLKRGGNTEVTSFAPVAITRKENTVEGEVVPQTADAVVRLKAKSVDALLQEIGVWGNGQTAMRAQTLATKNLLRDFEEGIERMQRLLKEVEISAEAQISSRKTELENLGNSFDPLEMDRFTRLQEATRIMAEGVDDLVGLHSQFVTVNKQSEEVVQQQARGVRTAQEVVTEARLTPIDSIGGKLRKVVAIASKETGKQVRLEFSGDDVKIDRAVLDKMTAPLEHLLRNSVAHGIESGDVRKKLGKPSTGTIWVEAIPKDNTIVLSCRDDGAGVNTEKVRAKAIEKGWLSADDKTPEQEINALIFKAGFSTADAVSNIAGRGVGMDVVKTEVEQLGGQIQMMSTAGHGTVFMMEVPMTIATTQALVVKTGDEEWALPAQHVKEVLTLKEEELKAAYKKKEYMGGQLFSLTDLLSPYAVEPKIEAYNTIIRFSFGERELFVQVDKILATEDVVIRPLAKPLSLVQGLGGTAYLGEGRIGLLVQPFAMLARKERLLANTTSKSKKLVEKKDVVSRLTAMVVDDSLTVRKVTGDLLRSKGIKVLLAKDGVDALEQLQGELPDIMLVDLEMPRMNGFELVEHIRNTPKFSHLPIVMITSRKAEKHQETAKSLGVNAYLGKPYQENELMGQIAHWTKHPFFDKK